MLTVKKLKELKKHFIFATGTAIDNESGLFIAKTGKELRWVAVTGEIGDWTIYCHLSNHNAEWIQKHGKKIFGTHHIKMCVNCDYEAFKKYRY